MTATALLLYCRPGFEKEASAEIQSVATDLGAPGYARARTDSGYLTFHPYAPLDDDQVRRLRLDDLIFARQLVLLEDGEVSELPGDDRISPLLERLRTAGGPWRELRCETADTNEAKSLSGFLRKFTPALESALRKAGLLDRRAADTLHLFFLDSKHVLAGRSTPGNASPWPLGIPRLRFPSAAPSRSTLKLEEAFLHFLDEGERAALLREGATGVDLGAAPGGWTWQLVKHGLQVIAIDNGPMDPTLMRSGQVEHLRVDGFHFRPARPVSWLVCDMVEQPLRIAALCAGWVADGAAERAIFNLKLPMKKRFEEVRLCQDAIARTLGNRLYSLRIKQLYHDREEVTAYLHLGPSA